MAGLVTPCWEGPRLRCSRSLPIIRSGMLGARRWRALGPKFATIGSFRKPAAPKSSTTLDFTPLHDQLGSIIGAICILRETTERHRMEHLSKLETVAQLTGGVAHDFNNLLTAATGYLELILRESKNKRVTSFAETALRSINRGAQLTQQLLAFARRQALRPVSADRNRGFDPSCGRRDGRCRYRRGVRPSEVQSRSGPIRSCGDEPCF